MPVEVSIGELQENNKRYAVLVDDDEAILLYLEEFLKTKGLAVASYTSAEAFLADRERWETGPSCEIDLFLIDLQLPGMQGAQLLKNLKRQWPQIPVVMMTAFGNVESAVGVMKEGSYDYIEKPFDLARLSVVIENSRQWRLLNVENTSLKKQVPADIQMPGAPCVSPAIRAVYDLVRRVSQAESSILITGESGVGKEIFARAVHDNSSRSKFGFVSINCSAIPESLLESELFGHTKGAFTGAVSHRKGLFEEAEGGTLFLDEIGELDFSLQAKLLRVLQERKVRAVGDNKFRSINVRIIAATNKNLAQEIKNNRFREDLYYRLNVIPLHIPPLRQRREDIPILAEYFLERCADLHASPVKGFTQAAKDKLMSLSWSGNVRELQNVIERSVVLATSEFLDDEDIPVAQDQQMDDLICELAPDCPSLKEIENRYIFSVLKQHHGKTEEAARVLGLSRRTLYRKISEINSAEPSSDYSA